MSKKNTHKRRKGVSQLPDLTPDEQQLRTLMIEHMDAQTSEQLWIKTGALLFPAGISLIIASIGWQVLLWWGLGLTLAGWLVLLSATSWRQHEAAADEEIAKRRTTPANDETD